jgi:hypothetical protein
MEQAIEDRRGGDVVAEDGALLHSSGKCMVRMKTATASTMAAGC